MYRKTLVWCVLSISYSVTGMQTANRLTIKHTDRHKKAGSPPPTFVLAALQEEDLFKKYPLAKSRRYGQLPTIEEIEIKIEDSDSDATSIH